MITPVCKDGSQAHSKLEAAYLLLKRRIADGTWQVGARIPTEVELSRELKSSRSTIGVAISRLVHEGLVERRPRVGTRVLRPSPVQPEAGAGNTAAAAPLPQLDAYAFIYSSELHEGIFRTVQGFQLAAREHHRRVVTLTTGTDYHKEAEFVSRLPEFDVKGAVMNPLVASVQEQLLFSNTLRASRIPIVLAGASIPGSGRPCAMVDSFHAGFSVTRHLIERGARKIGFIANHAWAQFICDRQQGYRWALKEAGLAVPARGLRMEDSRTVNFTDPLAEPTALARAYLANLAAGEIDAVVCADDHLATGMIRAALEKGLRVPASLRVAGIGDLAISADESIPLTSYRVPYEKVGREAFRLLEACLATQGAESVNPPDALLEGQVVPRASTA